MNKSSGEASGAPRPPARSLRGLDGLNFLMADVRDGVGPYLAVFLKADQHWPAGQIGIAMAASGIAAALAQIPAGLLVDASHSKRALVAGAGLLVALGCLSMALFPGVLLVIAAQAALGAASAVIPPALAALSLGIVGRARLPGRISRNESFNHAGNLIAAILAGTLGHFIGYRWIFFLVCGFAVASAVVVRLIDPAGIDHDLARGGEQPDPATGRPTALPIRQVLARRDLRVFLIAVLLFHLANAAMLPLAGQVVALAHPGEDAMALSACIIAAQLTMVGIAWAVGRAIARGIGRKPIFLAALLILPLRGVLFALTDDPYAIVAIQVLDGVAAGIFGVVSVLIAADLMRGTGRFNLAQGLTALAVGVGASLSNLISGFIVQVFGYQAGFLALAGAALCALGWFAALMPETRDRAAQPDHTAAQPGHQTLPPAPVTAGIAG